MWVRGVGKGGWGERGERGERVGGEGSKHVIEE